MEYWPSARWKIQIALRGEERWVEPSLPFAMIGAHRCCVGCVNDYRVPDVAYFACCFSDGVEVWPLVPLAFPRWGLVEPEHSLSVGRARISLFHEKHRHWHKAVSTDTSERNQPLDREELGQLSPRIGNADVVRRIRLDWDGKARSRTLKRRVLILGDDHPSTLRLHGLGLRRCDHAIVGVGDRVWMINLQPFDDQNSPEDLISELFPGASCEIGRLKVSLGATLAIRHRAACDPSLVNMSSGAVDDPSNPPQAEAPAEVIAPPASPEAMTSSLTTRLVLIDKERFTRRRLISLFVYLMTFMISIVLLGWITVRLVVPLLQQMG